MPAAIAIPLALGAGTAAAGLGGAYMSSSASKDAADMQTQAANHAADVQKQSADAALAFQKQQAAQDLANAQAAQRGNYDQWAAKQGRLSTLGQMVGMKAFQIPAYVPIQSAAQQTPNGTPMNQANPNVTTMGNAFLRQPNGPMNRLVRPVQS